MKGDHAPRPVPQRKGVVGAVHDVGGDLPRQPGEPGLFPQDPGQPSVGRNAVQDGPRGVPTQIFEIAGLGRHVQLDVVGSPGQLTDEAEQVVAHARTLWRQRGCVQQNARRSHLPPRVMARYERWALRRIASSGPTPCRPRSTAP